tara:strand:+ start:308 stop:460 length:153 start_codon:yes stop_codon:yes gene_type:complete
MADMITIGHPKDTGPGKKLNTGGLRRSYNMKKKRSKNNFKISKNKYVEGK